jgi:nucleotide-binding universal stress UspA family protein
MLAFSKLLLPVDFSPSGLAGARYAISLADRFHSTVTFLHVEADGTQNANYGVHGAQGRLENFLCAEFGHLSTTRLVRSGDPAEEIVSFATADGSDLIMMPTRGYGKFRKRILGSVAAKVLHDAACPVWTGAHLSEEPSLKWVAPARILCAIDTTEQDKTTLAWASQWASLFNAQLVLFHAEPRFETYSEEYYSTESYVTIAGAATDKINEMQREVGTNVASHIGPGHVPEAVGRAINELYADVLIIGRGSGSGSGRLGLNTYGIIRESGCPVISV